MAVERARRRELAELVADHVFGDGNRHMLVPVVDAEGEADEVRQDGGATAPDLDDVGTAGSASDLGLLEKVAVDERAFPE